MWIAERAYDLMVILGEISFFISIAIVIPALIWKRLRRIAGWSLRTTSYVWGTGIWLSCGINLGLLWGVSGLLIGLTPVGLFLTPFVMIWHRLFKQGGEIVLGLLFALVVQAWGMSWIEKSKRQELTLEEFAARFSTDE